MRNKVKRREFLLGGMAMAGLVVSSSSGRGAIAALANEAATSSPAPAPTPTAYTGLRSRPDMDGAPKLNILTATGRGLGGYLFLTPISSASRGPAIFDTMGRLVWFQPTQATMVHNLQLVKYRGEDLLAWYEGEPPSGSPGYAVGSCVLYDRSYNHVTTIFGHESSAIDLHDMVVTPQGTALVEAYVPVTRDLTSMKGAPNTTVLDWLLQEIEISSGKVLFTWSALDHIALEESVTAPPTTSGGTYDYFHGNSIEVDDDNNLIISGRDTSAIYKIDRSSGQMIWRLRGGVAGPATGPGEPTATSTPDGLYVPAFHPTATSSASPAATATASTAATASVPPPPPGTQDLVLKPDGESFWFQHDVRRNNDGTVSIFDDGAAPFHHNARGIILDVDTAAGTATIRQSYSVGVEVDFEGSFRLQSNGTWLAGWGGVGRLTEFSPTGDVEFDATFAGNSYRALHFPWHATPSTPPAVAAERGDNNQVTVWASWN
ncbi:MAG: arylsulfotransferase family protein, partial [Tepidiformaceae bacterium]